VGQSLSQEENMTTKLSTAQWAYLLHLLRSDLQGPVHLQDAEIASLVDAGLLYPDENDLPPKTHTLLKKIIPQLEQLKVGMALEERKKIKPLKALEDKWYNLSYQGQPIATDGCCLLFTHLDIEHTETPKKIEKIVTILDANLDGLRKRLSSILPYARQKTEFLALDTIIFHDKKRSHYVAIQTKYFDLINHLFGPGVHWHARLQHLGDPVVAKKKGGGFDGILALVAPVDLKGRADLPEV
jgi:hypothetical protein